MSVRPPTPSYDIGLSSDYPRLELPALTIGSMWRLLASFCSGLPLFLLRHVSRRKHFGAARAIQPFPSEWIFVANFRLKVVPPNFNSAEPFSFK